MVFPFVFYFLKFYSGSNLFFRDLTSELFLSSVHFFSFVKRKANYIIEQQKCKRHKKRNRPLVSIMEFNFQISQRNKKIYLLIQFSQIGFLLSKKINHKLF